MPTEEPLSVVECLKITAQSVFVRKFIRPTPWIEALTTGDMTRVVEEFRDEDGVSLWCVQSDKELRRVAIALNEGRDSFHESLDLLPILPEELRQIGIACTQTPGGTSCPPAAALHYEATMDDSKRRGLLQVLLAAKRSLGRCTKGKMKRAASLSEEEGCFALKEDSTTCACGETRP